MSFDALGALVVFAAYALTNSLLAATVALLWGAWLRERCLTANELFALRLSPAVLAALLSIGVVLPAFLLYEPRHRAEATGPVFMAFGLIGMVLTVAGACMAWRSARDSRALTAQLSRGAVSSRIDGWDVEIIDIATPIVAVIGAWRPRFVAARCVVSACTREELASVLAHERAHVQARDNLKQWIVAAVPDTLAWIPTGQQVMKRWRAAAERAADEEATAAGSAARLALASALIKVARLATSRAAVRFPGLSTLIAWEGIETRVRLLMQPEMSQRPPVSLAGYAAMAAVCVLPAVLLLQHIYRFIEGVVQLGR